MIRRYHLAKAGSMVSLPFLLLTAVVFLGAQSIAREEPVPVFQEFESSCIDLAHYDAGRRELTVRF
ncbi:MAG TPA: hypothetical protein VNT99_06240, partial [Methylomirabilota bacterium]|nr:hypothetical protein [Methylomirabilota bacterium]